jgi:hypothetical protein
MPGKALGPAWERGKVMGKAADMMEDALLPGLGLLVFIKCPLVKEISGRGRMGIVL